MSLSDTGSKDSFSRRFIIIAPIAIPFIVFAGTFIFYPFIDRKMIWFPLLFLYWGAVWGFTLWYHKRRGDVFSPERFKLTLKLKGEHLKLQYIIVYGPLIISIPLFILNYAAKMSVAMYFAVIAAAIVNGPTEEIFWRGCMNDACANAGFTEKQRLIYAPIVFALWHTAFVYHLYPHDETWVVGWFGIIITTWISGVGWLWVLHRSGRLVPQCFYHTCANFLNVFPMIMITVIGVSF
jgi:hypothetical protein